MVSRLEIFDLSDTANDHGRVDYMTNHCSGQPILRSMYKRALSAISGLDVSCTNVFWVYLNFILLRTGRFICSCTFVASITHECDDARSLRLVLVVS